MKTTIIQNLFVAALIGVMGFVSTTARAAESPYKFERGFPSTGEKAYDDADLRRAAEEPHITDIGTIDKEYAAKAFPLKPPYSHRGTQYPHATRSSAIRTQNLMGGKIL